MPNTTVNGIDLYYEIHGSGAPLVLISGLASDSQSWLPVLEPLSRYYQVIVFDNRGVGRTRPEEAEVSVQKMADDCVALIKHLGLSSVNLLGHSMGGFIAMDCAVRYPEHVHNLILASTSAFNSERNNALFSDWASYLDSEMDIEYWFRNIFYWIFSSRFFNDKDALNDALVFAIEYPYPQTAIGFRKQIDAIKEYNCLEDLPGINTRTLVLCGKEDLLFPSEESIKILDDIPNAVFAILENAAHSIHMEEPDEFIDVVRTFLENSRQT